MSRPRRQSASDVAKRLKVDPFKYLCEDFNCAEDWTPEKRGLALELLPCCYLKLKGVDFTGSIDGTALLKTGGSED